MNKIIKTQPIRPAATVIIARESVLDSADGSNTGDPYEIFMLRRTSRASFAGGMYVFPGGRVDPDDHLHAIDPYRVGPSAEQALQQQALGAEWRGYWIAGIRECLEEAAILLAYDKNDEIVSFADDALHERMMRDRQALHDGTLDMVELCEQENIRLAVDKIHFFNRFVTPLGRPRRFDTRFFITKAPPEQVGHHDDVETVDNIWISPSEALAKNAAGEFELMRVTVMQLQALAGFDSADALVDSVAAQTAFPITRPAMPRE